MVSTFDRIRHRRLMGDFAQLAALDRSSAAVVLSFLADETGTSAVEAAIVATRAMELADAEPPSANAVLDQVSREIDSAELRFPISGRAISESCHPAQARRLVLATLENLRPETYAALCTNDRVVQSPTARRHLTLVPPEG